jgi:hypothetical protein
MGLLFIYMQYISLAIVRISTHHNMYVVKCILKVYFMYVAIVPDIVNYYTFLW